MAHQDGVRGRVHIARPHGAYRPEGRIAMVTFIRYVNPKTGRPKVFK